MKITRLTAGLCFLTAIAAVSGSNAETDASARPFDPPAEMRRVRPDEPVLADYPDSSLTCFYYAGFMVKAFDTGSPVGDDSVVFVALDPQSSRPACAAAAGPRQVVVKGDGHSFAGVKGRFAVMSLADPNGAVPFVVYDRHDGKMRYRDSQLGSDFQQMEDDDGVLHLRYTRAFNAGCSVPQDGLECWTRIGSEARLPASIARLPPPACADIYKKGEVSDDDPSIIAYDVDVRVSAAGGSAVVPLGPPRCIPMP